MPYFESPPTWLLGLIVALIIGTIVLGSHVYTRLASAGQRSTSSTSSTSSTRPQRSKRSPALNYRTSRSRRYKAVQPAGNVPNVQPVLQDNALVLSPLELQQLARAISSVAAGATEQVAIELSFHCTKGAGKDWKRAKILFDAATRPTKA